MDAGQHIDIIRDGRPTLLLKYGVSPIIPICQSNAMVSDGGILTMSTKRKPTRKNSRQQAMETPKSKVLASLFPVNFSHRFMLRCGAFLFSLFFLIPSASDSKQYSIDIQKGLNFISFPCEPVESQPYNIFDTGIVCMWSDETYKCASSELNGSTNANMGYFIKSDVAKNIMIEANDRTLKTHF